MEREKATKDLMNLVHDIVGATCSMRAGIEVFKYTHPDDEKIQESMERMKAKVDRVDKALDEYYLAVKGEKRN